MLVFKQGLIFEAITANQNCVPWFLGISYAKEVVKKRAILKMSVGMRFMPIIFVIEIVLALMSLPSSLKNSLPEMKTKQISQLVLFP